MRIPKRKAEEDRRKLSGPIDNHITQKKLDCWKKELIRLKNVDQRPAAEEVARTQAMGDLSENAAYQDAKWRLRRINKRMLVLKERIKHAIIIEPGVNDDSTIRVGSKVIVYFDGNRSEFEILGTTESNPFRGRISYSSPLGSALMNKRVGDEVSVKTEEGSSVYQIIDVK